jgi:hypothetical protein
MSVIPIRVNQKDSAVRSLNQAMKSLEVACSFIGSRDIHNYLPYTVYAELVKSASNTAQGIRVCLEAIESGVDQQITGEDLIP